MTPQLLLSTIFVLGFVAAPLVALLYGPRTGLVVLAGALAMTISLAWSARGSVAPHAYVKLKVMLGMNAVLLIATVTTLLVLSL